MRIRSILGLAALTAGMLASGAALASPTVTVNGITIPIGTTQINQVDFETQISATQPNLQGVGIVSSITNTLPGGQTYGLPGEAPPPYLYDEFSGFTINPAATFIDSSGALHLGLTGGQLSYYTFATDQQNNIGAQATATGAVNLIKSGTLFLSLVPQTMDSLGDTFLITLPSGNTANVTGGFGSGFLDVATGAAAGPANPYFNTCTFVDTNATGAQCVPGLTQLDFIGGSSALAGSTAFQVTGTDHLNSNTTAPVQVPEPLTISLFGAGLIGAAAVRRKAKKAA